MASLLSPLDDVLKRSGAHMTEREGWVVAADVSSIGKFELRDSPTAIADIYPSGRELRPGRVMEAAGAWWCVVSPELLLVLAPPSSTERVRIELIERVHEGTTVTDVTSERVAVCLTGPYAREVLTRAGASAAKAGSLRVESVGGVPTLVLHQYEKQWLLVASASEAGALWRGLSEAGSPLGLAYVGADALQHLHAAAGA
jgi:sarcosine oxidase gamma subunit